MIHRYPIQLTTLEEDFRAIGLLPAKDTQEISEADNSNAPRDIPSPDPSTAAGNDDSQPTPARHKYAKQLKPKESPDDNNSYEPDDGGSQKGKGGGSYSPPRGGKESRVESEEGHVNAGYKLLKSKIVKAKDRGQAPAVAQGLAPVKSIAGMKKEGANVSRAAELVSEVEALLNGSQMDEEFNGLVQGFDLISTNCSLLANRLVDIAEHYNVDKAISAMESLFNSAIEARSILEDAAKSAEEDEDEDLDLESVRDAFRMMTLTLMDAVEAYDATISEMKKDDDDDDDDSDDDDDDDDSDDDDDDDSDDDDKGGIAARMAKLKAGKKGPFGK